MSKQECAGERVEGSHQSTAAVNTRNKNVDCKVIASDPQLWQVLALGGEYGGKAHEQLFDVVCDMKRVERNKNVS